MIRTFDAELKPCLCMSAVLRHFDDMLDLLDSYIILIDSGGMILKINKKALQSGGYFAGDVLGTDVSGIFYPLHSPSNMMGMLLKANSSSWAFRTRSRIIKNVSCIVTPLYEDGKVAGAILSGIEPAIDSDMLRLYNDLLSHDVKNYNQVVMGYLEMVMDHDLCPDVRDMLERASRAIERGNDLVECVKMLIDIESGMPVENKAEPVSGIIDRNIRNIKEAYPSRVILTSVKGVENLMVASCAIIDGAFYNVLDNAVKYNTAKETIIEIEAKSGEQGVEVKISDNGPGIPDAIKRQVFNRKNKSAHGWGMGLSITRAIVERLGGKVSVEDRVQGDHTRGSAFVLTLPKA